MTELALHRALALSLLALGPVTFGVLLAVDAPYGRHRRPGFGPTLPSRAAWLLMESPAVLLFAAVYLHGERRLGAAPLALGSLWLVHYLHRALVYPLRVREDGQRMPVLLALLGFGFNVANAWLNARWISHLGDYPPGWLADSRFLAGLLLFAAGLAVNRDADRRLLALRAPDESGYHIPRGGLFERVSCPNYLGEIVEWLGWALATWSLAGLAFAAYTFANLAPRARAHHRWYRRTFADYPPRRRALVPFLW